MLSLTYLLMKVILPYKLLGEILKLLGKSDLLEITGSLMKVILFLRKLEKIILL